MSTETANSKSSWSHFPHDADIGVVGVGPTKAEAFRYLSPTTTIDELGLSSLERVELMVALEAAFQTRLDEKAFSGARDVGQLRRVVEDASKGEVEPAEVLEFPAWNRSVAVRVVRRVALPAFILPLTRVFAWIRADGRAHLEGLEGPVMFASNHQSYMDTPVIMAALPRRWRYRLAPAMAKEFSRHTSFGRARAHAADGHRFGLLPGRAVVQCLPAAAA